MCVFTRGTSSTLSSKEFFEIFFINVDFILSGKYCDLPAVHTSEFIVIYVVPIVRTISCCLIMSPVTGKVKCLFL